MPSSAPKPPLNWHAFSNLPGAATLNFELLWRAAVHRRYSRYGIFAARAQQPGIEFQLTINLPGCGLGDPGRVYGWQTKYWANSAPGRSLTKSQREDVEDSIRKTEKHSPDVTDWVLVTKVALTAGDQTWLEGLHCSVRVHQWTTVELDDLLSEDGLLLRETYFGSLILTPERLAAEHALAAAEVKERWIPAVHTAPDGETELRRILAQPDAWTDLADLGADLGRFTEVVRGGVATVPAELAGDVTAIVDLAAEVKTFVEDVHAAVASGDAASLLGPGQRSVPGLPLMKPPVLRKLRGVNHPLAPALTNLIFHIREAGEFAAAVERHIRVRVAVVTGRAGYGKTQLAATLSGETTFADGSVVPAGVLMHGRKLGDRDTLNDFARQVTLSGVPAVSFDQIFAAVDAAAARSGVRLPVVIDGLNEAAAPVEWEAHLNRLAVMLDQYPNVVLICTVRDEFFDDCIPDDVDYVVELDGFDANLDVAIGRYFEYYKIVDADDALLPRELLSHPLALRIFCDVANPDRAEAISAAGLPSSLTGIFDVLLERTAERICALNTAFRRRDVTDAVLALGAELWSTRARVIGQARAQELLGDVPGRRWNDSLLQALEAEGILIRHRDRPGVASVGFAYDLLGGHVVAASLIAEHGAGVARLFQDPAVVELFTSPPQDRHPLASDVLYGLAGAMPSAGAGQLWTVVPEKLRLPALSLAAGLDAASLNTATVDALAAAVDELRGRWDLFNRLYDCRGVVDHPLNSGFLDRLIRPRAVADRDLRWTEWLRANANRLKTDAAALARRWGSSPAPVPGRMAADRLRARWLMWLLTSTDRDLRDAASAALVWFGRQDPAGLFELTVDSLSVNDAYVPERMLAAAYGVTMSRQVHDPAFEPLLADALTSLTARLVGPDASSPTSHALIRYYATGMFSFAARFYQAAMPPGTTLPLMFTPGPAVEALPKGDPRREEVRGTLRMDFGNYTLGRLFPDRRNYDDDHPGHAQAKSVVLGVVHACGWREDLFAQVERSLDGDGSRGRGTVERYGKKYGWVGLHTVAGMLADAGTPPGWLEVDFDPSLPQGPPPLAASLPSWARDAPVADLDWLASGDVTVPGELVKPTTFDDAGGDGPWLLVHAFLESKGVSMGRRTFGLFNTLLVEPSDLPALLGELNGAVHPGRDAIDVPQAFYVFAGEVPWHDRFAAPEPGYPLGDGYRRRLRSAGGGVEFEVLAHSMSWESYHSSENQVGGYVPSRLFSERFDLRSVAAGFHQVTPGGRAAARTFSAPDGFDGQLLFLRQDLVAEYAAGRAVVTFGWGERETQFAWPEEPSDQVRAIYRSGANVWRRIWQT